MSAKEHAVVEVSADTITLRVGSRWLQFTHSEILSSDGSPVAFEQLENGSVSVGGAPEEEMDMAAERFAREMLHPA